MQLIVSHALFSCARMQEPLFRLADASALDGKDSMEAKQLAVFRVNTQAVQAVPANVAAAVREAAKLDILDARSALVQQMKHKLRRFEGDRSNKQLYSELQTQALIMVALHLHCHVHWAYVCIRIVVCLAQQELLQNGVSSAIPL